MIAASAGPATHEHDHDAGEVRPSNVPRVHLQPKTSVAPDTAVRTSDCNRCAGDGTQRARTPNAANSVAATMAANTADSDPRAVGADRPR